MTATLPRTELLQSRLGQLRAERDQVQAETVGAASGDVADRATNVDANVRFAVLEHRIQALEAELFGPTVVRASDGRVAVGDTVTLDFGDGPEVFLVGSVEEAGEDLDVLTPTSPLGRAVLGAAVGDTVSYAPRPGRTLQATVLALA